MEPVAVQNFLAAIRPAFEADDPDAAAKQAEARHVGLVLAQFEALGRGDFAAFLDLLADDIELEILGPPALPFAGKWRGRDQVAQAVPRNFALLQDQEPEILSVVAQGDVVVVTARERGRVRATGRPYEIHWVQHYTFRDGRLARCCEIVDSAPLLDALNPA